MQVHGALVQIQEVGVLLLGPSGVGKSEIALQLVTRGHALVADDVVELERAGEGLVGRAPAAIRHYLEIRGLGILFVPELYGARAVLSESPVDLVCRLERDRPGLEYDASASSGPARSSRGCGSRSCACPYARRPASA